jgi:hypothetical protein
MQHEGVSVLLASAGPSLEVPALPLLFYFYFYYDDIEYFYYDDIEAVAGVLEAAGVPVIRTGHPPHALGGEVKAVDPTATPGCWARRSGLSLRRRPRTKGSSGSPSCGRPRRWWPRGAAPSRPARPAAGTAGAARTRPR